MTVSTKMLSDISTEMADLVTNGKGDPEISHALADDLLIETLLWLVAGEENRRVEDEVNLIIKNWRSLGKWYA